MRWTACGVGLSLAGVLLSACGGSTGSSGAAAYVGRASNAVVFIQWTRADNNLSGSLQEAIAKEGEGSGLESSSRAFSGTVDGNGLTLTLNEGLGSTKALVGQMTGKTGFTMTYPGTGHRLITIPFAPGTVTEYNTDVRELESENTKTTAPPPGEAPSSTTTTPPRGGLVGNDCETLAGPGGQFAITAGQGVSCATARQVFSDLWADKGEHHEGANSADSYTIVDGWTCGSGAGGFGCSQSGSRIEATAAE